MSILKNIVTDDFLILKNNHSIGRSPSSSLRISESDVSKNHATISWDQNGWQLKDHSRNGSKLNGKLVHHTTALLKQGDILQFGTGAHTQWQLLNEDSPKHYLRAQTSDLRLIRLDQDHVVYPDTIQPAASFFKSRALRWMIDDNESTLELVHGHHYHFGDLDWMFFENEPMADTFDLADIVRSARIDCHLSSDEESVEIKIVINDLEMSLGEKVYNFLLLLLARQRLEDVNAGLHANEQGWLFVEPLLQALSKELFREVDIYYFNVMIHRFRDHVRQLKPYGHLFANVIERKRGKIRLNYSTVRIIKEN